MTDLRSPLPAGNGFREFGGPRLCQHRCRRRERSAEQFACSPRCDCAVSFRQPHRSALSSALWDPVAGLVWVKTEADTFALSRACESETEWMASERDQTAKRALDALASCTNPR